MKCLGFMNCLRLQPEVSILREAGFSQIKNETNPLRFSRN